MENEILELEKKYWQAIKDRDVAAALAMTDDPCLIAGATGVRRVDHESFQKIMKGAKYTLHSFEVKDDAEVRMLDKNTAIIAYNVHEELTVDDKPVSMDASDASTWIRKDGKWVCSLHSEAIHGDPYGRDRA